MTRKSRGQEPMDPIAGISDREAVDKINRLRSSLVSGKIGRRDFMVTAIALGLSTTAASSVFNTARAMAKKGGRLRTGTTGGATSDVLDPGLILDSYMINVLFGQVRNNLTEVSNTGELVPELAESWDSTPDAKTWTFKIRQGVEFHNGKSLDAQDVVDSIRHHLHEDSKSAAKGILKGIESVEADGKHGVTVNLTGGDADFPFLMSDYHVLICPSNGDGTIDWQSGTGTGGYTLAEHEPGIRTLTKRNPNYWKEGKAHFDEVETLQIADPNARLNGLRTNSVDCINNVDPKIVERLKRLPGIHVRSVTGNKQLTLPMRTDTAPFDNNDVRLAVKSIINREEWFDKIIFGYGEIGNDNPIGPANIYRATTEELPQRIYDPDKAKHHLKQAGMDRLSIQFHAAETAFSGAVNAGQLAAGIGPSGRHRHRGGARAGRRLLVQRLDEQGVQRLLLERPAHRELDLLADLRGGRELERHVLEARPVQRAAGAGAGRAGYGEAPGDVRRDAAHRPQRGRRVPASVPGRHDGAQRQAARAGGHREQLGAGRPQARRTVVVRVVATGPTASAGIDLPG